jgi:Icc protein
MKPVRFIQISDPHVCLDPSEAPHGIDPNESLGQVVRSLLARLPVDFVVVTGDLIGDDEIGSYEVLRSLLAPLPCPVHLIVGNHDLRAGFWQELGPPGSGRLEPVVARAVNSSHGSEPDPTGPRTPDPSPEDPYFYEFEVGGYRFLALDSQIPGEVPGWIDARQMKWIESRISARPDVPTIVFVHHPPIATGVDWLDEHRIGNGEELMAQLGGGNVERVFFGHVHMPMALSAGSILCTSAPSTCYGFSDAASGPLMIGRRPGFQIVEAGGGVRSHIEWV